MIGTVDVAVQALNPSMPLYPMRAFVSSPTSIRVRNVPKRIGKWAIESVQFTVAYPDGSIKTAQCVLTGGVWVGTIEGTSTSGTSKNGYTIFASGTDENGNTVTGYILGKGDIEILEADGTLTPGETLAYVHLLSVGQTGEKDGDLWQTDGTWKIQQDGQSWLIGDDSGMIAQLSAELSGKQDTLTDAQISAIDSVVDERATVVKYQDGTISSFNIVGEIGENSIPNKGDAVEVKIGSSVTEIGYRAFYNCTNLTSVTIPDSVTSIGNQTFRECSRLTNITMNSVTSIDVGAFHDCSSLTNVTIPASVTSIGTNAFLDCSHLTNVSFQGKTLEQVQNITYKGGNKHYPWGISNTSIITTWNDASQEWVTAQGYATTTQLSTKQDQLSEAQMDAINKDANAYYTTFYVQGESQQYSFIAPNTLTKSDFAALGVYDTTTGTWTKNLTSIRTGTNVTNLQTGLFKDVTTLRYFEGPELKFSTGGAQVFSGCTGLQTLILPKVILIPALFCAGCTALSNLTIPASLTTIGRNAFQNCSNLQIRFQEKTIDEVQAIVNYPWGLNASQIKADRLSDNQVFAIDQSMDEALTKITYRDPSGNLTFKFFPRTSSLTLQDFADVGLYNITTGTWTRPILSVKTGSNVTNLETNLFKQVTSLTTFDGPNVEIVGGEVFSGCTGLNQVSLPSVKTLMSGSFFGCTSLTSLNIPASITDIRIYAFNGCTNLTVHFEEKTLAEVQAMLYYPWGLTTSNITVSKTATQEWVAQNYVTQTYAVKNDGGVAKVMSLTERQYERLEDKDPTTLYVIPEEV